MSWWLQRGNFRDFPNVFLFFLSLLDDFCCSRLLFKSRKACEAFGMTWKLTNNTEKFFDGSTEQFTCKKQHRQKKFCIPKTISVMNIHKITERKKRNYECIFSIILFSGIFNVLNSQHQQQKKKKKLFTKIVHEIKKTHSWKK